MTPRGATIAKCLESMDVDSSSAFVACGNIDEEWKLVKKAYYKKILVAHPDKGGDAAAFREVNVAFEVLRGYYDKKKVGSFATAAKKETRADFDREATAFEAAEAAEGGFKSWDFYYEAAAAEVPLYRVEPARSDRSTCVKTHEPIPKGAVRVGSMNMEAGAYGRWNILAAWRVPSRVWEGLPDPASPLTTPALVEAALLRLNEVLLCGVGELSDEDRAAFVAHCMDKGHWAKLTKRRAPPAAAPAGAAAAAAAFAAENAPPPRAAGGRRCRRGRQHFVVPRPADSVAPNCLAGKTCAMVESFGGRVTSSISGRTDILIVGKEPGMSKVSKARAANVTLMTLHDLKLGIEGGDVAAAVKPSLKEMTALRGYVGRGAASVVAHGAWNEDEEAIADAVGCDPAEVVAYGKYAKCNGKALGDVLGANKQFKTGKKDELVAKVVDAAAFGAPAPCDVCGKGKPKAAGPGRWQCGGYYDEMQMRYVRCSGSWASADLARYQWLDASKGYCGAANGAAVGFAPGTQACAPCAAAVEAAPPPKAKKAPAKKKPAPTYVEEEVPLDDDEADDDVAPPKRAAARKKAKAPAKAPAKTKTVTKAKAKKPAAKAPKKAAPAKKPGGQEGRRRAAPKKRAAPEPEPVEAVVTVSKRGRVRKATKR
ncbi:hypothetical protein JL721_369 [Aureococcus anophagefferens]|nr:hypothetical protein JL721_369 [Aureococcus anophagefferens]